MATSTMTQTKVNGAHASPRSKSPRRRASSVSKSATSPSIAAPSSSSPYSLLSSFVPPASASKRIVSIAELEENCGIGSTTGRAWVGVHGHVFDITDFSRVHPGGHSIRLAAGRDATCLIESYHPMHSVPHVSAVLTSQRVTYIGVLATVASGVDNKQQQQQQQQQEEYVRPNDAFFIDVRQRVYNYITSHGDSNYRSRYALLGELEALVTFALYVYACIQVGVYGSWFWALGLGFLTGRMGFLMHMGNHCAVSGSPFRNRVVGWFMDVAGSNATIWGYEHQVAHHMDPNEVHRDNDCEIGNPIVRMHPLLPHTFWQKYQHFTVPIGMTFGFFKWIVGDFEHFWNKSVGNVRMAIDGRDWMGMVMFKGAWGVIHVIIPFYFCGWRLALAQLVLFMGVGGHYLENIFIVNHIQNGLVPESHKAHWADRQILATANWCSGSCLANWISGGLNHQIEHHLFPALSYYWYPHIAGIVATAAREHHLTYANYTDFPQAWLAMIRYLKDLGDPAFVDTKGNHAPGGAPACNGTAKVHAT